MAGIASRMTLHLSAERDLTPLSTLPLLRTGAWLACGVLLAQVAFHVAAVLSLSGILPGRFAPVALVALLACLLGILLCRHAPRRLTYLLGGCIACYLPAGQALIWTAAFVQDLFRGQGVPGVSVKAVMAVTPNTMLMLAMAIVAVVVVIAGRLAARAATPTQARLG